MATQLAIWDPTLTSAGWFDPLSMSSAALFDRDLGDSTVWNGDLGTTTVNNLALATADAQLARDIQLAAAAQNLGLGTPSAQLLRDLGLAAAAQALGTLGLGTADLARDIPLAGTSALTLALAGAQLQRDIPLGGSTDLALALASGQLLRDEALLGVVAIALAAADADLTAPAGGNLGTALAVDLALGLAQAQLARAIPLAGSVALPALDAATAALVAQVLFAGSVNLGLASSGALSRAAAQLIAGESSIVSYSSWSPTGAGWATNWGNYTGTQNPYVELQNGPLGTVVTMQSFEAAGGVLAPRMVLTAGRPLVAANRTVTARIWARAPAGATFYVGFKVFSAPNGGGELAAVGYVQQVASGGWDRIDIPFARHTADGYWAPNFGLYGTPAAGTQVEFASIELFLGDQRLPLLGLSGAQLQRAMDLASPAQQLQLTPAAAALTAQILLAGAEALHLAAAGGQLRRDMDLGVQGYLHTGLGPRPLGAATKLSIAGPTAWTDSNADGWADGWELMFPGSGTGSIAAGGGVNGENAQQLVAGGAGAPQVYLHTLASNRPALPEGDFLLLVRGWASNSSFSSGWGIEVEDADGAPIDTDLFPDFTYDYLYSKNPFPFVFGMQQPFTLLVKMQAVPPASRLHLFGGLGGRPGPGVTYKLGRIEAWVLEPLLQLSADCVDQLTTYKPQLARVTLADIEARVQLAQQVVADVRQGLAEASVQLLEEPVASVAPVSYTVHLRLEGPMAQLGVTLYDSRTQAPISALSVDPGESLRFSIAWDAAIDLTGVDVRFKVRNGTRVIYDAPCADPETVTVAPAVTVGWPARAQLQGEVWRIKATEEAQVGLLPIATGGG